MDEQEAFREEFVDLAAEEGVSPGYANSYYNLLFEIATGLVSRGESGLTVVGIAGAQGTGKSTFAKLLAVLLERVFEKASLVMSLDDFYLTRAERVILAAEVHPLLNVRGVPGTHDTGLLRRVIADLQARRSTSVPVFNKAADDRQDMIPVMGASLDILIIEGWCWGALPAAEAALTQPVNQLEAEQDGDRRWRRYVNQQLASSGYQEVFEQANACFFLAAPDFETVFEWRWQQEQRLAEQTTGAAIMSREQVREFIMYFERVTRRMLEDLPKRANVTLYLDRQHRFVQPPGFSSHSSDSV